MAKVPVGLQLYTVRNELEKDFEGTLAQVAEIGYPGVEFAGYFGRSAGEIAQLTSDLNLSPVAAHIPIEQLEEENLEETVEFHLELGCEFLVVPWLPEARRKDRKKWRTAASMLTEVGADIKDYGLRLCYHNHAFEFDEYAGHLGFDLMFEKGEDSLFAEIDVYWVQFADRDPVDYLKKVANRCPLVHLKDMAGNVERNMVEVGEGTINLDLVFEAAEDGGVEWYFVEQDECQRPPLESARISFENLKKMGKV